MNSFVQKERCSLLSHGRYVQLVRAPVDMFIDGIMDLVMMEVVDQLIEQAVEHAEDEKREQDLAPSLASLHLQS